MLYRAVYAGKNDPSFQKTGYDYFVIVMRFMFNYMRAQQPDAIHVFWDAKSSDVWRKEIYKEYKDGRGNDILDDIIKQNKVCLASFQHIKIRQYYLDEMEADDLIYAFCRLNYGNRLVIVSSDSDLLQIPYRMDNCMVYNPLNKRTYKTSDIENDPVMSKALMGDKSDNITGYYRIGPVKSKRMCENHGMLVEFYHQIKHAF